MERSQQLTAEQLRELNAGQMYSEGGLYSPPDYPPLSGHLTPLFTAHSIRLLCALSKHKVNKKEAIKIYLDLIETLEERSDSFSHDSERVEEKRRFFKLATKSLVRRIYYSSSTTGNLRASNEKEKEYQFVAA